MTVMGFDFGLVHLGVAVGQSITRTARGVATLKCRAGKPQWREVTTLVDEYAPGQFVVGLPLNMDGSDSPVADPARAFAQQLAARYALPVCLQDERLTSKEADRHLHDARATDQARTDHELAACLITQDWLASH